MLEWEVIKLAMFLRVKVFVREIGILLEDPQ